MEVPERDLSESGFSALDISERSLSVVREAGDDFSRLSRRQLQHLSKVYGIRANQSNAALIEQLQDDACPAVCDVTGLEDSVLSTLDQSRGERTPMHPGGGLSKGTPSRTPMNDRSNFRANFLAPTAAPSPLLHPTPGTALRTPGKGCQGRGYGTPGTAGRQLSDAAMSLLVESPLVVRHAFSRTPVRSGFRGAMSANRSRQLWSPEPEEGAALSSSDEEEGGGGPEEGDTTRCIALTLERLKELGFSDNEAQWAINEALSLLHPLNPKP
jgi:hypothetical protein